MKFLNHVKMVLFLTVLVLSGSVFSEPSREADNTGINVRDQESALPTADQQMEGSPADVELTRKIRQALVKDESLSINAHNIKIVTLGGRVTLRGPVASNQERMKVAAVARRVAGRTSRINNDLEIAK